MAHAELFKQADTCLVQTEIPASAVEKIGELAATRHIPVILKPADCAVLDPHVLSLVDFLVPNEDELAAICPQETTLEARCEALCAHGARTIIVTRGEKSCFVYGAAERAVRRQHLPDFFTKTTKSPRRTSALTYYYIVSFLLGEFF